MGHFCPPDELAGYENVVRYEGEEVDGVPNGMGVEMYANGVKAYAGQFKNGLYDGFGELRDQTTGSLIYSGEFIEGLQCGWGESYNENGVKLYSGLFENGMATGEGTCFDENGHEVQFSGDVNNQFIDEQIQKPSIEMVEMFLNKCWTFNQLPEYVGANEVHQIVEEMYNSFGYSLLSSQEVDELIIFYDQESRNSYNPDDIKMILSPVCRQN